MVVSLKSKCKEKATNTQVFGFNISYWRPAFIGPIFEGRGRKISKKEGGTHRRLLSLGQFSRDEGGKYQRRREVPTVGSFHWANFRGTRAENIKEGGRYPP